MTTFAEDILEAASGEPIRAVVIGRMGWDTDGDGPPEEGTHGAGKPPWAHVLGRPISWADALPLLSYDYDDGFGAPDCQAVYAWTPTRVLFVSQHDGSTSINSVPRNPRHCNPQMPGG